MLFLKTINIYTKALVLIFFGFCTLTSFAQNKEELQEKKEKLEQQIELTNKLLSTAKNNKNASINTLSGLKKKLVIRNEIIHTLEIEITLYSKQAEALSQKVSIVQEAIYANKKELEKLKTEYGKTLNATYFSKSSKTLIAFIFSSKNFNQAYKRIKYFREYSSLRRKQSVLILEKEEELKNQLETLEETTLALKLQKRQKNNTLNKKQTEQNKLKTEKEKQENLVVQLSKKEGDLQRQVKDKIKKTKALESKIRKIIEAEIKKAREAAKATGVSSFEMTPEQKLLADNFTANKGTLPWPVNRGVILEGFGKQKHAVLPGIETYNNGIKIATEKGASIRAVFNGTVSKVLNIPGSGQALIISHGDYFSVYSGLSKVSVKQGDRIKTKQAIGVALTNLKTKETLTELQIWKGSQKLNPAQWIYRAY